MEDFFACGGSAPVGVECEGGAAAPLWGTLAAPSVQGHGLPLLKDFWPSHSLFFEPLVAGAQKVSLASSLSSLSLGKLWEMVMDREAWCAEIHGVTNNRTRPSDWTELN